MNLKYFLPIVLAFFSTISADPQYTHLLEAPYPPEAIFIEEQSEIEAIHTIDDVADFELGKQGSIQRERQEYHRRLLSSIDNAEGFYRLHEVEGYLVRFSTNEKIPNSVHRKIKTVFDQSMRRIYYAGYGCETLEETLYDHEELQSAISRHYPNGIPLDPSRLSLYFKGMACGYRKNYMGKIKKLREERLTVFEVSSNDETELIRLGINPLRIVLEKKSEKPLAIWKAGSDKYYGKFLLIGLGMNEKLYELESAKMEMGYIATWHELLGQAVNYLYRGKFLTPVVAKFGNTTLHAYHRNDGSLSQKIHQKGAALDAFIDSLDTSHVQHWAIMQFLMSSSDSHRGNTLVDGNHLILIDFGRALGLPNSMTHFQLRCTSLDFPQMRDPISAKDKQQFAFDLTDWFYEFVEGIEKFEERKVVQKLIAKSVDHLHKNIVTLRLAMKRDLTPYQIYRLKYPPINLEDHFSLEALFKEMHRKDLYGTDVKDREIRQVLTKLEIFKKAPFMKAFVNGQDDDQLFEHLIDKELEIIENTPEEELYSEIQLGWLIRASLIIPLKWKPFF